MRSSTPARSTRSTPLSVSGDRSGPGIATPWGNRPHDERAHRQDPQRGPRGPRGLRQDDAGRGAAAQAGAINRIGGWRTARPSPTSSPRSRSVGISISLALAPFEWEGHKINLIDTPGYADFIGDVDAALRVADLAVFVVSAVDGVEVQTEMIWRMAEELGVPRMVFVNKLDRERADFERTLDQLRDALRRRHRPAGAADRRGGGLPGRGRPAHRQGLRLRRRRRPTGGRDPRRPGRPRAPGPRQPRRGHRRRPTTTLLERYLEGDVPSVEGARAHPGGGRGHGARSSRSCAARPPRASASTAWPTSSARSARRPPTGRRHGRSPVTPTTEVAADPERRAAGLRVQDRSPTPTSGSSRCSRSCPARSRPTTTWSTPARGADERLHGLFHLRGEEQVPTHRGARPATSRPWPS